MCFRARYNIVVHQAGFIDLRHNLALKRIALHELEIPGTTERKRIGENHLIDNM